MTRRHRHRHRHRHEDDLLARFAVLFDQIRAVLTDAGSIKITAAGTDCRR